MNIQDMKLAALQKDLNEEERPEVFIENFNNTWKLQCYCHKKTSFSFSLWWKNRNDWRCHSSVSDSEAESFLRGAGHV